MRWRRSNLMALGIVSTLAFIFILLAIIMRLKGWELVYGLSCNFAATCLTIVILTWVYSITGGEPLQKQIAELRQVLPFIGTGLLDASPERQSEIWHELLKQFLNSTVPPENVDIIGIALKDVIISLHHERGKWLDKIVKGCNIRILVLDPDGEAIKTRWEHEKEGDVGVLDSNTRAGLAARVKSLLESIDHEKPKGSFKFGVYDITPYCHILRIGRKMLVTNYLYGTIGYFAPTFLLREADSNGIFGKYMEHFESIWDSGKVQLYRLDDEQVKLGQATVLG